MSSPGCSANRGKNAEGYARPQQGDGTKKLIQLGRKLIHGELSTKDLYNTQNKFFYKIFCYKHILPKHSLHCLVIQLL